MKYLKYLLVTVSLLSWVANQLLRFVPDYSQRVFYVDAAFAVVVIICGLVASIRRQWSTFAIFCLPIVIFSLPGVSRRLQATGFSIYASPLEQYLSRCRLFEFFEDGKKRQVGECEGIPTSGITWDYVIYDTAGQLVLPLAQRTPEWKSAVGMLSSPDVYIKTEGRASHIVGDFYRIGVRLDELQGG
jgi:hypothetical protein